MLKISLAPPSRRPANREIQDPRVETKTTRGALAALSHGLEDGRLGTPVSRLAGFF